ncbi:hypothetical protein HS048_24585 [Planomonospora sp. ID91781]|uniref:hypothetical protein n=1 Tax=Planomonospora sp. ID91781 TaxID=2738135 RepID=UPI0018C3892B|nr:hypothetical protein [Planomonospora sp. ID91781]MBG0823902.1 hypothetical protein [Planomonospora sp. ID91781]
MTFRVAGRGGVPASGVSAVALNLIAINPVAFGWFTVHPSDAPTTVSTLTFHAGESAAGEDFTRLTSTGEITVVNNSDGDVHISVAVDGYFSDTTGTGAGDEYYPLSTTYIYDTRPSLSAGSPARTTPVPANGSVTFQVAGRNNIPATDVTAVAVNMIATGQTARGWLSLHPSDEPDPLISSVDYVPGETDSSFEVVRLTGTGQITVDNHGTSPVHISVTARGFFSAATGDGGLPYRSVEYIKLVETLTGLGTENGSTQPLAAGATLAFDATTASGAPSDAVSAVALNINARRPTHQGWLSVYPADEDDPGISSVNFDEAGESTNGFDLAIPSSDGRIHITNHSSGTVHLQVTARGFYIHKDPEVIPDVPETLDGEGEELVPPEDGQVGAAARRTYKDYTRGPIYCYNTLHVQPAPFWVNFRRYNNGKTRLRWVKVNGYDEKLGTKETQYAAWRGDGGKSTYFWRRVNYHYAYWNIEDYIGRIYIHKSHKPYVKIGFKWKVIGQPDTNCVGYVNVY